TPRRPATPPPPKGGRPWIEDRTVLGGSSMCCAPGCLGGCSRPRSWAAAAARPAGGASATGNKPGLGGLASPAAGLAGRRRAGRLVPGRHRLGQCPGAAWGELVGATPADRAKPGSKYHLLIDATGVPLAVGLSAANTHDSRLLEPMVDAVP